MNKEGLDTAIQALREDISDIQNQLHGFRVFKSFAELGLVDGEETIASIAEALPNHSQFQFHKKGNNGNSSIYPHASGSLIVTRFALDTRVSFHFERSGSFSVGYYDSLNNPIWSGWEELQNYSVLSQNGNSQTFPNGITNLSTFKTVGDYYITTNQVNALTDAPYAAGGFLSVRQATTGDIMQEYTVNSTSLTRGIRLYRIINSQVGLWYRYSLTLTGTGSPEGVVLGNIGLKYIDTNTKKIYEKTTDGVNTGWKEVAVVG